MKTNSFGECDGQLPLGLSPSPYVGDLFLDALKHTAKRVAYLDLLGYHSRRSGVQRLLGDLPSVKAMQEFVQCDLLRRTERGRTTIIVTRCTTLRGLPPQPPQNVVVYTDHQCQGAPLAPESPGGKAMLERLYCG